METLTRAKDATYNGLTTGASYVASGATTAKETVVNYDYSAAAASTGTAIVSGAAYAKDSVVSGASSAASYVAKLWTKTS